jgi:hypothetical protein
MVITGDGELRVIPDIIIPSFEMQTVLYLKSNLEGIQVNGSLLLRNQGPKYLGRTRCR